MILEDDGRFRHSCYWFFDPEVERGKEFVGESMGWKRELEVRLGNDSQTIKDEVSRSGIS